MALQLNWTAPSTAVDGPQTYARVVSIFVNAITQTIDVGVGLYVTSAARGAGSQPFDTFHARPDYTTFLGASVDVRSAAYSYLKTLPEFGGALDV